MLRSTLQPLIPAIAAAIALSAVANGAQAPRDALSESSLTYVSDMAVEGVTQIRVSYSTGGTMVGGTIFENDSIKETPGVLFLHDGNDGVDEDVARRCRDLAAMGFVVFAPDYKGGALGSSTVTEQQLNSVLDATKALASHPRVIENRIGLMGTSHGGYLALRAAAEAPGQWRAVVQASGAIDVPSTNKRLNTPVLLQHGWKDETVLLKHANHLDATLRRAGNTCELKEYTMLPHNLWFWEGRNLGTDQVNQAQWAWKDCTKFLSSKLQLSTAAGNTR